jgi:hypothetical protein
MSRFAKDRQDFRPIDEHPPAILRFDKQVLRQDFMTDDPSSPLRGDHVVADRWELLLQLLVCVVFVSQATL